MHPCEEPRLCVRKPVKRGGCRGRKDALGYPGCNIGFHVLLLGTDKDRNTGPPVRGLVRSKNPFDSCLAGTGDLGCGKAGCTHRRFECPRGGVCRDDDPGDPGWKCFGKRVKDRCAAHVHCCPVKAGYTTPSSVMMMSMRISFASTGSRSISWQANAIPTFFRSGFFSRNRS